MASEPNALALWPARDEDHDDRAVGEGAVQLKLLTRAAACRLARSNRADPEHVTEEPDATHERKGVLCVP
jgi:hypothetical protein